jgi:formiminotetrahydrofolate cyclodeaminase
MIRPTRESVSMPNQQVSIGAYLDALAARQPTPGGGSATGLAGALAAAMGEMVLNYSVGRKGLEAHQDQLKAVLAELHRARQVLLQLMVEDQLAYETLSRLKKLPPDSPQRRDQLDSAIVACIRVPQAMSATGAAIIELCDRVADVANRYLLSDLAVCADLAMATVRCAAVNVRVNLPELTDPADRQSVMQSLDATMAHALGLIKRVYPRIWTRIGSSA